MSCFNIHCKEYEVGVLSGIRRVADWLRDHGDELQYTTERGGDNDHWIDCPDIDKLSEALIQIANEYEEAGNEAQLHLVQVTSKGE
jgi:hypothetical protein